jgi:hypothetical protein
MYNSVEVLHPVGTGPGQLVGNVLESSQGRSTCGLCVLVLKCFIQ